MRLTFNAVCARKKRLAIVCGLANMGSIIEYAMETQVTSGPSLFVVFIEGQDIVSFVFLFSKTTPLCVFPDAFQLFPVSCSSFLL